MSSVGALSATPSGRREYRNTTEWKPALVGLTRVKHEKIRIQKGVGLWLL